MGLEQNKLPRSSWLIAGVSIAVLMAMTMILYSPTILYLTGLWSNFKIGEYGHGFLVLAISIYMVVSKRRDLAKLTPCPTYWTLPAIAGASLLWLVAILVDVNMMQTVALLLLLTAIVWTIVGKKVIGSLLLPLLFIGFAIPIWFPLSPLLQDLTADVVFWLIRMLDVPAFREQNMIVVPAGRLSIEEACSGLRYFLAALTLGTLYAYLNYRTLRARVIVVAVAAATAVLANFVRVFIVVYLGYATDMQHPYVHDHLMLGWYLFGGLVAVLLFVDARLYRHYQRKYPTDEMDQPEDSVVNSSADVCDKGNNYMMVIVGSSALALTIGPAVVYSIDQHSQAPTTDVELALPKGQNGWTGPLPSNDDWMPVYKGATNYSSRYFKADRQVTFYLGYYMAQSQGEELINDLNRINNKEVWATHYPRAHPNNAGGLPVLEQLLKKNNGEQRLVWYWYQVAGIDTTSPYEAKLLQALGLVMGQKQAYVAAVAVDIRDSIGQARGELSDFVTTMHQPLQRLTKGYD